jgi:amidase
MGGAEQILGVIGPLSTSIAGIKLFMQTLIDTQPWLIEPSLVPLPWRSNPAGFGTSKNQIRVGVMSWDGVVRPHPPVQRAFEEVVIKMLANELVDVVHWEPSGSEEAWEIIVRILV